jgi:Tol biopolymer transport system component
MSPDGSGRVRLTNNAAHDAYADWSPDGQRIVFYSDRDGSGNKDREIYSMNADGSDQTRLTTNSAEDLDPNWGP